MAVSYSSAFVFRVEVGGAGRATAVCGELELVMALLERGVRGVEAVALVHKASIGGEELALFRALVLEALEQRSGPAFSVGLACALDGVLQQTLHAAVKATERTWLEAPSPALVPPGHPRSGS